MKSQDSYGIVLVVLCVLTVCSQAQNLQTTPQNVAAVAGDSVVLNCKAAGTVTSPQIFWSEYITKPKPVGEAISSNDNVVHPTRGDRYSITPGGSAREFNLNIATLTEDGGEYDCRLFSPSENAYAQVVVLDLAPQCESSAASVVEGTGVTYNCHVKYYGKWAPIMEWTATGADLPTVDNTTDGENVGYSFTITTTADDNGATFTCDTRFNQPQSVGPGEADNVPDYQHTCGPISLEVQYKPRNIVRIPDDSDITAGKTVTCHADANPGMPGDIIYTWLDIETNETVSGAIYTFSHDDLGDRFLRCVASNTVDYATEDFNFTVAATTTTTTTTTTTPTTTTTSLATTEIAGESSSTDNPGGVLSAGAIAGIAIGAAIFVVIIILLIFWFVCRKSPKKVPDTRPSKPVPADAVRAPDVLGSKEPIYDNDSPYNNANYYGTDPRNKNAEGLVYADLALDDTPRSRKPIQVYEPTQYAEIQQRV